MLYATNKRVQGHTYSFTHLKMMDIGFQVTLARGTEWAATGKVTLPEPKAADMASDKVIERQPPAGVGK